MRHSARSFLISGLWMGLACVACSSDAEPSTAADGGDESPEAGKNMLAGLELAAPPRGFQVRSRGADIKSGHDVEYCEVAQLPGDPSEEYYVDSFEFANQKGSHHLIVQAAVPGSVAEAKLEALGVGNRVDCLGIESEFGPDSWAPVGGSQQPYRKVRMPDGVGRKFRGGQFIVFDYHYLNTREETIHAESAVNFHLTDASAVDHIARGFSFSNYMIATAPGADAEFTGECHFNADVMLGEITRHTHRWGTDFTVWYAGGEQAGEEIWSSDDWQHKVEYQFDAPRLVRAGEGLRFRCGFRNDTDRMLRYGTSATDEMCILFGTIWEAEKGQALQNQSCTIVWQDEAGIGHAAGEAGGFPKPKAAETEACLSGSGDDACSRCRCEACAAQAIQCATDNECKSIRDCYGACEAGTDCAARCEATVDAHSSGIGPITQMSACFQSRCADTCN